MSRYDRATGLYVQVAGCKHDAVTRMVLTYIATGEDRVTTETYWQCNMCGIRFVPDLPRYAVVANP